LYGKMLIMAWLSSLDYVQQAVGAARELRKEVRFSKPFRLLFYHPSTLKTLCSPLPEHCTGLEGR
jgi:hypothetical protein